MVWRLQATHVSLTYARCDVPLNELLEFLKTKRIGAYNVVEVIVSHELHADGAAHRHAYVRFNGRIDLRRPNFFDINGFHPNVLRTENVPAWKNYVRKDGDCLEWSNQAPEENNLYALARTLNHDDFFERARALKVQWGYARHAWEHSQSELSQITFNEDPNADLNFVLPRSLSEFNFSTNLTNVIVGPTGCGKTLTSIRNMTKPILFVSHLDQLRVFSQSTHRSILFDDMNFSHLPETAQIHLCDRGLPRSIHRRYGTTLIPAGVQVTITCNERPFNWSPPINRRLNILTIN